MRMLIAAIAIPLLLMGNTAGCEREVAIRCPGLKKPPRSIVVALEKVAREDAQARAYVIDLAKHYEKLAVCQAPGF